MTALAREMTSSSSKVLETLVEAALTICHAHSAGISLLSEDRTKFYWPAVAGQWASLVGAGTPRDFGPCGTVLDQNAPLVFSHPERDFPYLASVTPHVEEGLLIPFHVAGNAVGTIWIIAHDQDRRFDAEDLRVMTSLGTFAASAYQMLRHLTERNEAERRERASAAPSHRTS